MANPCFLGEYLAIMDVFFAKKQGKHLKTWQVFVGDSSMPKNTARKKVCYIFSSKSIQYVTTLRDMC